jgi:ornithine cyclodeaminase/alanine dehydrogenase-like protein (mu-crystallin family)
MRVVAGTCYRLVMFLSEEEVRRRLRLEDLIPAVRRALVEFSAGRVVQPVRTILRVSGHQGFLGVMPAVFGDIMGAKLVTFYPGNAERRLPTHHAMIQLFSVATGEPLATMDGRLITELRTAAVSAVATDLLASPDARVLAILGSGVQARSHWEALRMVRPFGEVRVWSRTPEHAEIFARETGARAMTAEAAVRGADVVVTVTSSPVPVLRGAWLKAGSLVNAVGAVGPAVRELDDEAMRGTLIVESRESVAKESGDVMLSGATVYAELGELLAGGKPVPRGQWTVFKSVGIAVEDLAAARLVYENKMTAGC